MTVRRLALWTAAGVIAADQVTKVWAVAALEDGPVSLLGEFLRLRLVRNPGAAFGQLRGAGSILALIAIAVVIVIFLNLRGLHRRFDGVVLGLILGGAAGNLIDRVARGEGFFDGKVIDFVDFDFWPVFNVADSAITIGAVLAIGASLWSRSSASPSPVS